MAIFPFPILKAHKSFILPGKKGKYWGLFRFKKTGKFWPSGSLNPRWRVLLGGQDFRPVIWNRRGFAAGWKSNCVGGQSLRARGSWTTFFQGFTQKNSYCLRRKNWGIWIWGGIKTIQGMHHHWQKLLVCLIFKTTLICHRTCVCRGLDEAVDTPNRTCNLPGDDCKNVKPATS